MTAPFTPSLKKAKPFERIRRLLRRVREMATPQVIELKVHLAYDDEADVWYVASSDIPGLSLEADDPLRLIERIEGCALELACLNMAEIERKHARKEEKPAVTLRPVFDSPMQLVCA